MLRPLPRGVLVAALLTPWLDAAALAQGVTPLRSTYHVDQGAAWVETERGAPLPPSPSVPSTVPVSVQDLRAGVTWSEPDAGQGWVPQTVALGHHGLLAFAEFDTATDRAQLVSGLDTVPITPLWEDPQPWTSQDAQVAAAAEAGVLVSCRQMPVSGITGPRNVVVSKYSSASRTGPDWEYTFPFSTYSPAHVRVSRDGSRIVAGMLDLLGTLRLAIFDAGSGVPNFTTGLPCGPQLRALLLSGDGSTLYWASGSSANVWNVATHSLVASYLLLTSLDCHAISGDGSVFAFGGFNTVDLYERQVGGSYQHMHQMTVPGQAVCSKVALSNDGSTLVAGFNLWDFNLGVVIRALDVPTKQVIQSDTAIGGGTLQNIVSSLAVCDDGSRFAVGLWGDQAGWVPELRLYRRGQNAPARTYDYPGSVYALDISPDGRRVLVGTKAVHANLYAGGGAIDQYRFEDEDFVAFGIPGSGDKVRLELSGAPGSPAVLILAPRPAPVPLQFAGVSGSLYLDRLTMTTRSIGTTDATGLLAYDYQLPSDPLVVGTTQFLQGLTLYPRAFTADWVRLVVLP